MKKTILFIAFALIATIGFSQSKGVPAAKPVIEKVADTLVVDTVKYKVIRIGNTLYQSGILGKPGIYLTVDDINFILNNIQEYPAKFANPYTAWFQKFLGIK